MQNTNSQYNLPAIGKKIAYKANRDGRRRALRRSAVQKSIEVDLALIDLLRSQLLNDARTHASRSRPSSMMPRPSICCTRCPASARSWPWCCSTRSTTSRRFPRVQDFVSYCRLVKCAKESAGKRYGISRQEDRQCPLKWAFSEAAVLFLRGNAPAQKYVDRLARKHGKAKAITILAHRLGRAVYHMLRRGEAFDNERFLTTA